MGRRNVGVTFRAKEQMTKELRKMRGAIKRFSSFATSRFAAIGAAIGAIALGKFFKNAIKTAVEGQRIWDRLGVALGNVGVRFRDVEGDIRGMAAQLQATTKFGDEEFADALAILLGITNDYGASVRATTIAMGLAVKHQISLKTASELVGKAMAGQTGTLSRYGIIVDKNRDILEQLDEATKGYAESSGKGLAGALAKIKNAWDDMNQALGNALLGFDDAEEGGNSVVTMLQGMEQWIVKNSDVIQTFVRIVIDSFAFLGRGMGKVVQVAQILGVEFASAWLSVGPAVKKMSGNVLLTLSELLGESRILLTLFGDEVTRIADQIGNAGVKMARGAEQDLRNIRTARDEGLAEIILNPPTTEGGGSGPGTPEPPKPPPGPQVSADRIAEALRRDSGGRLEGLAKGQRAVSTQGQDRLDIREDFTAIADESPIARVTEEIGALDAAIQELTGTTLVDMRQAFGEGFAAAALETGNLKDAAIQTVTEMAKGIAKTKVKEQLAEAASAFAAAIWPPNPVAALAGVKHLAAAAAWQKLGGVGGGGGGGGGAGSARVEGGLAPDRFTRDQQQLSQGDRAVFIIKGRFDPTSPQFLDELAAAVNSLGRNRQIEFRLED